jgi:putative hydrolase of the HAD superfamily
MINSLVFDLDNTLIDFLKMKKISIDESVCAMIGAGLKKDKSEATKRIFEIYDKIGMESKEIFQKYLKEANGEIDYRILGAGVAAYRRVHTSFYEPFPSVIPTLIKLKADGKKLAILSDAPRLKAWIRLCYIKVEPFIDVVVTFDDTKKYKPHKKPFLRVLKELKESPENCLMVGDNFDRDIVGAYNVGMKTCFAKYGSVKEINSKITPDYSIGDFSELIKIVKN